LRLGLAPHPLVGSLGQLALGPLRSELVTWQMDEPAIKSKPIARALPLIALLIALPVAARANPWCTLWKNQQMCVSVEDFQIFAKRTCLQAQTKENPTAEESMALHGDCQAAKNIASKAEAATAAHERAVAAQRELNAMPR
jgi:hypothetical protein